MSLENAVNFTPTLDTLLFFKHTGFTYLTERIIDMPHDFYNKKGEYIGSSVESEATPQSYIRSKTRNLEGSGSIISILIGLAVLYPIISPSIAIYDYLKGVGVHTLFSFILAVIPFAVAIYILYKYVIARAIYSGALTLWVASYFFSLLYQGDLVWASFFAVVSLLIGGFITYRIYVANRY